MDIETQETKPISDDQELAKALAGVSQTNNDMGFEETPSSLPTPNFNDNQQSESEKQADEAPQKSVDSYIPPSNNIPVSDGNNNLDGIRKSALNELRPLVDKLELQPEEKFDIYLLLLRNTDDTTLIAPAHAAAQNITDETRRAQALLDVIKEIDYLSTPQQPAE